LIRLAKYFRREFRGQTRGSNEFGAAEYSAFPHREGDLNVSYNFVSQGCWPV
jgi:hypothetical protein